MLVCSTPPTAGQVLSTVQHGRWSYKVCPKTSQSTLSTMASMNCQADFAARYREYLLQHLHTTAIPHVCTFCCTVLGAATPSGWGVHTLRRVLHMRSGWIAHHSGARAGATAPGPCSWPDHLGPTGQPAACSCLAVVCHPMPACMCGTCRAAGDSARAYLLSLGCPGLVKPRQLSIWTTSPKSQSGSHVSPAEWSLHGGSERFCF